MSGVNNIPTTSLAALNDGTGIYQDTQTFTNTGASTVSVYYRRNAIGVRTLKYDNYVYYGSPSLVVDNENSFQITLSQATGFSYRVIGIIKADATGVFQFWGNWDDPLITFNIHVNGVFLQSLSSGALLSTTLTNNNLYIYEAQFAQTTSASTTWSLSYISPSDGVTKFVGDNSIFKNVDLLISSYTVTAYSTQIHDVDPYFGY